MITKLNTKNLCIYRIKLTTLNNDLYFDCNFLFLFLGLGLRNVWDDLHVCVNECKCVFGVWNGYLLCDCVCISVFLWRCVYESCNIRLADFYTEHCSLCFIRKFWKYIIFKIFFNELLDLKHSWSIMWFQLKTKEGKDIGLFIHKTLNLELWLY